MALTDIQLKTAKPPEENKWLSDEKGLRVLHKANTGRMYFRLKYRMGKKQKTLSLGVYPETTLKQARELRDEARQLIRKGIDPAVHRKEAKKSLQKPESLSFRSVAKEWWELKHDKWKPGHAQRIWTRLEQNALHRIGQLPISEIRPKQVIKLLREMEKREALDVARGVLQDIHRVFRHAMQNEIIDANPISGITAEILKSRKPKHRASLPPNELPGFLQSLDTYHTKGRVLTELAIKLLTYTFVRPGELRGARWSEIDFENSVWRIPAERTKMGEEHYVPLVPQTLELLAQIEAITGHTELLFPSERNRRKSMSDNTMRRAIFKLGYDGLTPGKSKCTPHGFRANACSILNESGKFSIDAIERQMAHKERNNVRAAYIHHARFYEERKKIMVWWANHLDSLKQSQGNKNVYFLAGGT